MAMFKGHPKIGVTAMLALNEQEMAALAALACYGTDSFLVTFYEKMGRSYLQPHEAGLRTLFDMARNEIPPLLSRVEKARSTFEGGRGCAKG